MPDFTPMILANLPYLLLALLFAGVVKLVVFINKRWKAS
jgi:hypothetical protein